MVTTVNWSRCITLGVRRGSEYKSESNIENECEGELFGPIEEHDGDGERRRDDCKPQ